MEVEISTVMELLIKVIVSMLMKALMMRPHTSKYTEVLVFACGNIEIAKEKVLMFGEISDQNM